MRCFRSIGSKPSRIPSVAKWVRVLVKMFGIGIQRKVTLLFIAYDILRQRGYVLWFSAYLSKKALAEAKLNTKMKIEKFACHSAYA